MWKNVARVVIVVVAPTIAVSNVAFCSACTTTPSLQAPSLALVRVTSCTCQQATAIQHRNYFGRGSSSLGRFMTGSWTTMKRRITMCSGLPLHHESRGSYCGSAERSSLVSSLLRPCPGPRLTSISSFPATKMMEE
jgi:hypothetical protein